MFRAIRRWYVSLSGASSHTQNEKVAPYALFGDTSGDYKAWTPAVGTYRLTVDADGVGQATSLSR